MPVSDPDHARYGQHLRPSEIHELIRPSDDTLSLVEDWLHKHVDPDRISYSQAKDVLSFTLPVSKIEELLETKYSVFQHDDGTKLLRTSGEFHSAFQAMYASHLLTVCT